MDSKPEYEENSLAYVGAHYYEPILGRFMGMDPVAPNPKNIHSLNRYVYANNNPYKFVDPQGRAATDIFKAISAVASKYKNGDCAQCAKGVLNVAQKNKVNGKLIIVSAK